MSIKLKCSNAAGFDVLINGIVFVPHVTYLKVDKRFDTYESTEIAKTGRYAAANAPIFKREQFAD